jgi:hypothetical protein
MSTSECVKRFGRYLCISGNENGFGARPASERQGRELDTLVSPEGYMPDFKSQKSYLDSCSSP